MMILSDLQVHQVQTDKNYRKSLLLLQKYHLWKKVQITTEMPDGMQQQLIELDRMKNNQVLIVAQLSELTGDET